LNFPKYYNEQSVKIFFKFSRFRQFILFDIDSLGKDLVVGTLSFEQLKPIKVIEVLTTRRRFSSIRLAHADYDHFSEILSALHALRTTLDLKSKKKNHHKRQNFFLTEVFTK
jgi:hypothetical protein